MRLQCSIACLLPCRLAGAAAASLLLLCPFTLPLTRLQLFSSNSCRQRGRGGSQPPKSSCRWRCRRRQWRVRALRVVSGAAGWLGWEAPPRGLIGLSVACRPACWPAACPCLPGAQHTRRRVPAWPAPCRLQRMPDLAAKHMRRCSHTPPSTAAGPLAATTTTAPLAAALSAPLAASARPGHGRVHASHLSLETHTCSFKI